MVGYLFIYDKCSGKIKSRKVSSDTSANLRRAARAEMKRWREIYRQEALRPADRLAKQEASILWAFYPNPDYQKGCNRKPTVWANRSNVCGFVSHNSSPQNKNGALSRP